MQLNLFERDGRRQIFLDGIDPAECIISRFNSRKTRSAEDVHRLASRMTQNGFELTRAVWVYRENGQYHVFAGGTRLEAASRAGVRVAVIVHEGYTEEDYSRLSDEDNENDEYHCPVSITDVWAEYARLRDEEGWTQEKIAAVKGISQPLVSFRQGLHEFPDSIKQFITQDLLTEGHLREITQLLPGLYFSPWLTSEQAWGELAKWSVKRTTRETRDRVREWKEWMGYADQVYNSLDKATTLYDFSADEPQPYAYDARAAFAGELANRQARTLVRVKEAEREIRLHIAQNLEDYRVWVETRTAEEARRVIRLKREAELLKRIHHGDFRGLLATLPDNSVDLIFADPPYAREYLPLYGDLAKIARQILKPEGSLVVYAAHYLLPDIFALMCPHLDFWWQLVLLHSGGSSKMFHQGVTVRYKPLLWFVKGGRANVRNMNDVIQSQQEKNLHDWQQGTMEARYCIEKLTNEGDLVVDPFGGTGTTAIAALESGREFWICDQEEERIHIIERRVLDWLDHGHAR